MVRKNDRTRKADRIDKQCSCHYSPPCTGECFECHKIEMFDKEIEHLPTTFSPTVSSCRLVKWGIHCMMQENFSLKICSCPEIYELKDDEMTVHNRPGNLERRFTYDGMYIGHDDIGNHIFLAKEEAERALAERQSNV